MSSLVLVITRVGQLNKLLVDYPPHIHQNIWPDLVYIARRKLIIVKLIGGLMLLSRLDFIQFVMKVLWTLSILPGEAHHHQ